jgi:hypothetical protein
MHGWAPTQALYSQPCAAPADVRALPTCRWLSNNSLSGTLPKEWSAMTSLTQL